MNRFTSTLVIILSLVGCVYAQTDTAPQGSPGSSGDLAKVSTDKLGGTLDSQTAQQLFEEANNYVSHKFAEFEKRKMPYDSPLAEKIRKEQRDLAARYAAALAARKLEGKDVYYLGMLYNLARNSDGAAEDMRRYLKENPDATGQPAQDARAIIVIQAAKTDQLAEAESRLAEYVKGKPQLAEDRYALENWMTSGYFKAADYDRALAHAQQALAVGKTFANKKAPMERDRLLLEATTLVSDVYLKLKRNSEAIATVQELRRTALSLPSGNLYKLALRRLIQVAPTINLFGSFEDRPSTAANIKEITAKEWIDRQPTTLADLRGQVVLVDFCATWCGPCRTTLPRLQKWDDTYRSKGLVILGVTRFYGNADGKQLTKPEELDYLRQFKKKYNLLYGFLVADSESNDLNYGVYSIPTSFLIDRRGVIRFISIGSSEEESMALGKMIKKLIAEPVQADIATTGP